MNQITIVLNVEELTACVQKLLSQTSLHANPLAKILATAVQDAAPRISERVMKTLDDWLTSQEFERRMREVYRDAFLGEASRLGRNAARAVVMEKPTP